MSEKQLEKDRKNAKALHVAKEKTREYVRNLWQIITRHSQIDDLKRPARPKSEQPVQKNTHRGFLLTFLFLIPYLLVASFGISFFWDFNAVTVDLWGLRLQFEGLLKIVSISGLIGYFTNWLAITMLFKPAQKRPLLGQGLIPAQKNRIAYRLARAVSDDLINPEIIKQKISESNAISRYREESTKYIKGIIDDPGFRHDLKQWVISYLDEMIADPEIRGGLAEHILIQIEEAVQDKSFEKVALKTYTYVKGQEMQHIIEEALIQIPTSVESGLNKMDQILDQLPAKIEEHGNAIENIVTSLLYKLINQLDVHKLVEENLRSYDEQHISHILRSATNEQLRYIQYLGAVLGLVGGFLIWEPLISFFILGTAAGLLLLIDHLIYSYLQSSVKN